MSANFAELLAALPENLSSHLRLTVLALALGGAVTLPLTLLLLKARRFRYPVLAAASVIQTIPSLALLALMVPVLYGLGSLTARYLGIEFSALGFYPALIGLTLYSILPMLRNAVVGILEVDPAMTEAARGLGMTSWQTFRRVELPLAAPVIIAGVRTATVWVVGMATLSTPVGQRSLGNYIFLGLQTFNWPAVLLGCVAAALLAILLDLLLGALEGAVKERRRNLAAASTGALLAIFTVGLLSPALVAWSRDTGVIAPSVPEAGAPAEDAAGPEPPRAIWVGSKAFTEQYILASLIGRHLRESGFEVREREGLGSMVIFNALIQGEIDCYVDYTGTIWANHMGREESAPAWRVLAEVTGWLAERHGSRCLGSLGFENAYGLAMRSGHADQLGIRTIAQLAGHARAMRMGVDFEFLGRPEWRSIRDSYGLEFADRITYDPTFMYSAVQGGEVDVISAFTSDGRVAAFDLVVLEDPLQAIPPYDAVILLSPRVAGQPEVVRALTPLLGSIRVERMRQANLMVDEGRRTVDQAAGWLKAVVHGD
jgi:osmoprotectant transport system permease protein